MGRILERWDAGWLHVGGLDVTADQFLDDRMDAEDVCREIQQNCHTGQDQQHARCPELTSLPSITPALDDQAARDVTVRNCE